jgi:hypothetical protein
VPLSHRGTNFHRHVFFTADDPLTKETLIDIAAKLKMRKHHPNIIGIQFVQIGTVSGARESLRALAQLGPLVGVCHLLGLS